MNNARWALFASVVITVVLFYAPYGTLIGYPLILLSTVAHELGHGIAALLTGGRFDSLQIHADASGVAYTATSGRLASAIVSAGGLVGPAVVAGGLFATGRHPRLARTALGLLGVGLLAADVLLVRNLFGFMFIGILGGLALHTAVARTAETARFAVVFVAVQLSLSVFSRADYLFTPVARTANGDMPSDVARMAEALLLPYWFWGGACGLFSILVLVVGIWNYLRR